MELLGFHFRRTLFEQATFRSLSRLAPKQLGPFLFSLLLFILPFASLSPARAQDQSKEYQIKAAFLFNFIQFIKWPPNAFTNASAPFCIGILGDDPFGSVLEATIQGESIDNHRLTVVRAQQIEDLENCQVIFVCKSEEGHIPEILSKLDSKPILTVSETGQFAQEGGVINFTMQGDQVRFEINPSAAERARLEISSKLLKLATLVDS